MANPVALFNPRDYPVTYDSAGHVLGAHEYADGDRDDEVTAHHLFVRTVIAVPWSKPVVTTTFSGDGPLYVKTDPTFDYPLVTNSWVSPEPEAAPEPEPIAEPAQG